MATNFSSLHFVTSVTECLNILTYFIGRRAHEGVAT